MKYLALLLLLLVACAAKPVVKDELNASLEVVEKEIVEAEKAEANVSAAENVSAEVEKLDLEENMNTIVELETSMGTMKIKLYDDKAPKTVENFKSLVQKGFYDGTIFHRVIKNFMIQGGDPTGTGTGGPGYEIDDEFGSVLKHSKKGILSMANAGPNTGGSQFFITLVATPWLDGKHAIFGELIEGQDVLDKIGSTPTGPGDRPKTEVKIIKARVVK
ncbi:Cyclophilin type peptidyl-prolyl cis-trans isomerase/CLD [uncultured archaeon]|nr:Cyclophilin type peptidyl-prolyl cis-trans isomerase/CLD [uncultured archaeon]